MNPKTIYAAALIALSTASTTIAADAPWFRGISDPIDPTLDIFPMGISGDGTVIVGTGGLTTFRSFRWTRKGGLLWLDSPQRPGQVSMATATSLDGGVIVGFCDQAAGRRAFRWSSATGMRFLPDPGFSNWAWDCSGDGSVVAGGSDGMSGQDPSHSAVYWSGGALGSAQVPQVGFGLAWGISANGSVIAGEGLLASGYGAFRWSAATGTEPLGNLPGATYGSRAYAVSADGLVIVGDGGSGVGFRWTAVTGMEPLGILPGATSSAASAVSADGSVVVGGDGINTLPGQSFIWKRDRGIRNLQQVLEQEYGLDLTGWTLHYASGIDWSGTNITGMGTDPSGRIRGWVAHLGQRCYANCDESIGSPTLTANDFQCFLNKYTANDSYANCDGSTETPALTVNDFQCFLNRFAAGCP